MSSAADHCLGPLGCAAGCRVKDHFALTAAAAPEFQLHISHSEEPSIWGVSLESRPMHCFCMCSLTNQSRSLRLAVHTCCNTLSMPTAQMLSKSQCSCKRPGCMWQGLAALVSIVLSPVQPGWAS